MAYVFRVLNDKDVNDINNGLGLNGKIKGYETKDEIRMSVASFVQNGSSGKYPWISLSKDFSIDNERYNLPLDVNNKHRGYIAVIDNHSDTTALKNKLVFDISDYDKVDDIIKRGGMKPKGKKDNSRYNPVRTKILARNSREVLAYSHIPQSDIKYVLSPIEADLLYTYLSINNKATNNDIDKFIDTIKKINISNYISSDIEQYLYNEEYINNKYLYDICTTIYNNESINGSIDYLNLFKELKNINRNYYKRILQDNNISINNNMVPDDSLKVYASRKYNQNKDISLFNGSLIVPKSNYKRVNNYQLYVYGNVNDLANPYEEYDNSNNYIYLLNNNEVEEYDADNKYALKDIINNCRKRI